MTNKEAIAHLTCERINCLNDKDKDEELRRMCISALEAAEKYKWHDLRKNPNDLPDDGEKVIVVYDFIYEGLESIDRFKNGKFIVHDMEVYAWMSYDGWEEKE